MFYVFYYMIIINLITAFTYAFDKYQAKRKGERVKESTLLTMSMLGGAFLGYLTMLVCHHKTRKTKFNVINLLSILVYSIILYNLFIH
ncbi:MAG TPA: DUF1294 domain-containing protein [Bacilli bacterium]|nr:DUF1294 domain-containing protein [Bacilli bacterium]